MYPSKLQWHPLKLHSCVDTHELNRKWFPILTNATDLAMKHLKSVSSLPFGLYYTYIQLVMHVAYRIILNWWNQDLAWWPGHSTRDVENYYQFCWSHCQFPKLLDLMCSMGTIRELNLRASYLKFWIWASVTLFKHHVDLTWKSM